MTADKAVYKCPKCDYCTHFPKALEAHIKFRKHFADGGPVKAGEPKKLDEIQPSEQVIPADMGETFDEKEVKEAIVNSLETAEKKTKTVKRPRKKAEKE